MLPLMAAKKPKPPGLFQSLLGEAPGAQGERVLCVPPVPGCPPCAVSAERGYFAARPHPDGCLILHGVWAHKALGIRLPPGSPFSDHPEAR